MVYEEDFAIVGNFSIMNELSMYFVDVAEEFNFKVNLNKTKVLSRSISYVNCFGLIRWVKEF